MTVVTATERLNQFTRISRIYYGSHRNREQRQSQQPQYRKRGHRVAVVPAAVWWPVHTGSLSGRAAWPALARLMGVSTCVSV